MASKKKAVKSPLKKAKKVKAAPKKAGKSSPKKTVKKVSSKAKAPKKATAKPKKAQSKAKTKQLGTTSGQAKKASSTSGRIIKMPAVGDKAPAFLLATDRGEELSQESLLGQRVVLYFYPKDMTPGCTREACEFQEHLGKIAEHDAVVLGVSADSGASHQKFRSKFNLSFPLGIDEDLSVAKSYGVWVEKNMYGKKSMGIQRATFIIDRQGFIAASWPKVKVEGHVAEVVKTLESMP